MLFCLAGALSSVVVTDKIIAISLSLSLRFHMLAYRSAADVRRRKVAISTCKERKWGIGG